MRPEDIDPNEGVYGYPLWWFFAIVIVGSIGFAAFYVMIAALLGEGS